MKTLRSILIYFVFPLLVIVISLFIGPSEKTGPTDFFNWLWGVITGNSVPDAQQNMLTEAVFIKVRLPRILLAFFAGGCFAASGAATQAIFRNPLASPFILGISSGAAFGAALALAISSLAVIPAAFLGGFVAAALSYFIAINRGRVSSLSLILGGIIVSGIFTALLTIVQFVSDPFRLQTIVHWTMGNLHHSSFQQLWPPLIAGVPGIAGLLLWRWRLNVLALGEEQAKASGMHPAREKLIVILFVTLATSGSIAVTGVIGMIDLVIPHILRMATGADNRRLVPLSFVTGGAFLVLVDDFSRSLGSFEIPAGVFTMVIGAPLFIFILKKSRKIMSV